MVACDPRLDPIKVFVEESRGSWPFATGGDSYGLKHFLVLGEVLCHFCVVAACGVGSVGDFGVIMMKEGFLEKSIVSWGVAAHS